ncbi:hypothetical protein GYH30_054830 [Glycine max]|uniref:Uncharacterized protein n=1 Tax=Glycine max TaxID=3847 RepID=A0A0R0EIV4_SOYBN|nr:hypothetical protein GYH30_054830 [Glycine max]
MRQILTDQTESNYLWLSNSDRCNCPTVTGALLRAYYKARLCGNTLFIQTSVINGTWWKAKILPYKQAIAAYDAAIAGLPSQIAYGGWQKICHAIPPWPKKKPHKFNV